MLRVISGQQRCSSGFLPLVPQRHLPTIRNPVACCSEKDCRPLTDAKGESVLESMAGWELWDGRTIPRSNAKVSPDGKFHLCENPDKRILCFFAPPGAS